MIQCCVKAINTLLYYQPVIFLGGWGARVRRLGICSENTLKKQFKRFFIQHLIKFILSIIKSSWILIKKLSKMVHR